MQRDEEDRLVARVCMYVCMYVRMYVCIMYVGKRIQRDEEDRDWHVSVKITFLHEVCHLLSSKHANT